MDLLPTIADITNSTWPPTSHIDTNVVLDGISFKYLLSSNEENKLERTFEQEKEEAERFVLLIESNLNLNIGLICINNSFFYVLLFSIIFSLFAIISS